MADRGCRDEMVIATKFTASYRAFVQKDSKEKKAISNFGANGSKSLKPSLEASLKKPRTDYIDIMYLHCEYTMSYHIGELLTGPRVGIHDLDSRTHKLL
jgi:aryl-alcohol dehydrogenase-like predicted oxidoreductase